MTTEKITMIDAEMDKVAGGFCIFEQNIPKALENLRNPQAQRLPIDIVCTLPVSTPKLISLHMPG